MSDEQVKKQTFQFKSAASYSAGIQKAALLHCGYYCNRIVTPAPPFSDSLRQSDNAAGILKVK
jgi:hypothetical protein